MVLIVRNMLQTIKFWFVDYSDPRSDNLWLINTPIPLIILTVLYVYGSLRLGPRLMANRKPFVLKHTIAIYNAIQVVANAVLFIYCVKHSYWRDDYDFLCEELSPPSDQSDEGMWIVYCGYGYLLLKLADYMDTLFFVLRKQIGHISFLHVYHHALMGLTGYLGARFIPGGNGAILVIANTFVHTFMYLYYLLSALDTTRDMAHRWKKHITQLQLAQFLLIGSHYAQAYLNSACKFPKGLSILLTLQNTFMSAMFIDFYVRTYWRKQPKAKKHGGAAGDANGNGGSGATSIAGGESADRHTLS